MKLTADEQKILGWRWHEIFGKDKTVHTEEERKARWSQWKAVALKTLGKEAIEYWEDTEACTGCKHLDIANAWCNSQGLLCTVNPITTFQHGHLGMACMGLSFEQTIGDLKTTKHE